MADLLEFAKEAGVIVAYGAVILLTVLLLAAMVALTIYAACWIIVWIAEGGDL